MIKNIVKDETIEIGDNIIKYGNSTIQLSNVSYFTVSKMPKTADPIWTVLGIIIGLLLLLTSDTALIVIGLISIAACSISIFLIYGFYSGSKEYLALYINSGNLLLFSCNDKEFLVIAEQILSEYIKNKKVKYSIDFKNCIISNIDN